jgi:hypothetical protein
MKSKFDEEHENQVLFGISLLISQFRDQKGIFKCGDPLPKLAIVLVFRKWL